MRKASLKKAPEPFVTFCKFSRVRTELENIAGKMMDPGMDDEAIENLKMKQILIGKYLGLLAL